MWEALTRVVAPTITLNKRMSGKADFCLIWIPVLMIKPLYKTLKEGEIFDHGLKIIQRLPNNKRKLLKAATLSPPILADAFRFLQIIGLFVLETVVKPNDANTKPM